MEQKEPQGLRDDPDWRRILTEIPGIVPELELDPHRTALLVMEMQHFHVHPDYGRGKILRQTSPELAAYFLGRCRDVIIPNIQRLLAFFRQHGLRVLFTTVGPELPDASDLFPRRRYRDRHLDPSGGLGTIFVKGTVEHSIISELAPLPSELVINRTSAGAFNSSPIDQILRNMSIDSLVITGTNTEVGIDTSARDAADRGYNCVLVEDACASSHPRLHEGTLVVFAKSFGNVKKTEELIAYLEAKLRS